MNEIKYCQFVFLTKDIPFMRLMSHVLLNCIIEPKFPSTQTIFFKRTGNYVKMGLKDIGGVPLNSLFTI